MERMILFNELTPQPGHPMYGSKFWNDSWLLTPLAMAMAIAPFYGHGHGHGHDHGHGHSQAHAFVLAMATELAMATAPANDEHRHVTPNTKKCKKRTGRQRNEMGKGKN